jgi:hypothetical protein
MDLLPKLTNDIHIKVNCFVNGKHWGLQLRLHFFGKLTCLMLVRSPLQLWLLENYYLVIV